VIIKPSYQSYPSWPNGVIPKPANIIFSDVYQAITANPIITLTNGVLALPQSGYTFPKKIYDIQSFDIIPYNAGQTGIYVLNLSAETFITAGAFYNLQIISGDGTYSTKAVVFSTGTTTNQLAIDTGVALSGLAQSGVFTYTVNSGSSTVTISEASPTTLGLTLIWSDSLATVSTPQPNQAPTGSLAQAQAYNPNITSGTYTIARWGIQISVKQWGLAGGDSLNGGSIDILLNTTASGYATALAQILSYGSGFPNTPSSYSASWLANILGTNP